MRRQASFQHTILSSRKQVLWGEFAGGQAGSVESYLDGAAFGQGGNTNLTFESSPPIESIAESNVSYASFSAQTSLTSGGLISYTVKSGTPRLHGSVYEYVNTNQLNAAGETGGVPASALHVNSPGFTLGGPVYLPKIYDGRRKTFFFFNYDSTYKTDRQSAQLWTDDAHPALPPG